MAQKYYPRHVELTTMEEIVNSYAGVKKRSYHDAMIRLRKFGMRPSYSHVSMFVKTDKYSADKVMQANPRAIQFRSKEFNLVLMQFVHSYEQLLYPTLKLDVVSQTRIIAKGLNPVQRAELLIEKVSHFCKPLYLLFDHSRFDATIRREHLLTTHRKYLKACGEPWLRAILKKQLRNKCYTRGGIRYEALGTRMSGDADTALGNSIVNADCLFTVMRVSQVSKYDMLIDGDDSVVIIEAGDYNKLDFGVFSRCGFMTKIDYTTNFHHIDFCQSRPLLNPPNFVRNPLRVISHSSICRQGYTTERLDDWLSAVGLCELSLNQGIPVLQEFAWSLYKLSKRQLFSSDLRAMLIKLVHKKVQVDPVTRAEMQEAWGIDAAIGELIETQLRLPIRSKRPRTLPNDDATIRERQRYESVVESSRSSWWCSG